MISIITPSFNQLAYLKKCCASVADQGVLYEHLVVDGGSTDGTVEWLAQQIGVRWVSERDRGMYDAINKGLAMAKGDIVAYLNCDEQYLPGTLGVVRERMAAHPDDSLVFGDALLVDPDGALISFRKAYPLRWWSVAAGHLYVLSCTVFFRATVPAALGGFDSSWTTCGDADFIIRALRAGYTAGHVRRYLATFTVTGNNLGASPQAVREMFALRARNPAWVRICRPVLNVLRRVEKVVDGAYYQRWPLEYSLYLTKTARESRVVSRASFRWPASICRPRQNTTAAG